MWQQFWIQNVHYIIEVFVAFLMITSAWIYLDGWKIERRAKTLLRTIGFFVLTVWGFIGAAPAGIVGLNNLLTQERFVDITGAIGFGLIFVSFVIDPVPLKPGEKPMRFFSKLLSGLWASSASAVALWGLNSLIGNTSSVLWRIFMSAGAIAIEPKIWMFGFAAASTVLLWLHYSKGIQSEWKFFYLGFVFLSIALLFSALNLWSDSINVLVASALGPYHIVWILEHGIKLVGATFLGIWAWGFIRFRIFPQIFSAFVALSFVIFIVTTIVYTGFILYRTQDRAVKDLETNIKTFTFALEKVKGSAILAARIVATNGRIQEAMQRKDKEVLFSNINKLMFENETDFMAVVNTGGEVMMRAEDRQHFGDSLANDPVVWRALDGKSAVTVAVQAGATIPIVSIRAASPIISSSDRGEPEIVGAAVTGYLLDTAFVDGIKNLTGLDLMVFANDTTIATTFAVPDTQTRLIGARELNPSIIKKVLREGKNYTGDTEVFGRQFLAAYVPMKDIEATTIGMLFTGRSQASILSVIAETMRLTFSVSLLLMIISIIPVWLIARFITYHQNV